MIFQESLANYRTMVIISRTTQAYLGSSDDVHAYLSLVRQQLDVNEIFTYDDLITRAKTALVQLASLAPMPLC